MQADYAELKWKQARPAYMRSATASVDDHALHRKISIPLAKHLQKSAATEGAETGSPVTTLAAQTVFAASAHGGDGQHCSLLVISTSVADDAATVAGTPPCKPGIAENVDVASATASGSPTPRLEASGRCVWELQ
jgi:hypothetical protein